MIFISTKRIESDMDWYQALAIVGNKKYSTFSGTRDRAVKSLLDILVKDGLLKDNSPQGRELLDSEGNKTGLFVEKLV
jgi:hypothetical protein